MLDLLIIGAGPAGISAAYEAKQHGLDYSVIEKGLIGNTIYHYPVGLTVFSTTNELEFRDGQLKPAREKPTREELLSYYVRFALDNDLAIRFEEKVENVEKQEGHFSIETDKGRYDTRNVLFAIGAMDFPRKLNVAGEDLPKVHDHFRETYPWVKKCADRWRREFGGRGGVVPCTGRCRDDAGDLSWRLGKQRPETGLHQILGQTAT